LNEAVPKALALLSGATRPVVTHQSGVQHLESLKAAYSAAGVRAEMVGFIDDMAVAYSAADLVVCRAGATTVAELAAAGVASVLVPFPHAADDHQTANARFLSEAGAAVLVPQNELTPERLAALLAGFDRTHLLEMASRARSLGRPDATDAVAQACMELAS
jgi:UDP-N-acetylglucosamine--N-acetylmuramyl-(pentapeptide) pyrophosphoryl-undecaprenol N-acetylglucosamine transferase